MSVERFSSEPQPLLLDTVEARLVGWFLKSAGVVLLLAAVLVWLALATWSAQDPSLTHATSGLTRNWLGPIGAIVADLMLQTLGFAAIFAPLGLARLIAPTNALTLSTSASSEKLTLPTPAWMRPAFSARNSTWPPLAA